MRKVPLYPKHVVKGDKIERFHGITVKRMAPYRCLDGHGKETYEMFMAFGARPWIGSTYSTVRLHIYMYVPSHI